MRSHFYERIWLKHQMCCSVTMKPKCDRQTRDKSSWNSTWNSVRKFRVCGLVHMSLGDPKVTVGYFFVELGTVIVPVPTG